MGNKRSCAIIPILFNLVTMVTLLFAIVFVAVSCSSGSKTPDEKKEVPKERGNTGQVESVATIDLTEIKTRNYSPPPVVEVAIDLSERPG